MARRLAVVTALWSVSTIFFGCGDSGLITNPVNLQPVSEESIPAPVEVSHPGDFMSPVSQLWGADFDVDAVRIPVANDISLAGNVFIPRPAKFPGPRPTIIFANSWSMN